MKRMWKKSLAFLLGYAAGGPAAADGSDGG